MTEDQYRLLKAFPKDKSYIPHSKLDEILGGSVDYTSLTSVYNTCYFAGYVDGAIPSPGLRITDSGLEILTDYELKKKRESEVSDLNYKKLKYDAKISERVYNTYWWTFSLAVAAFLISLFLLILKLAELSTR